MSRTSARTSLIRSPVPSSMPFMRETTTASSASVLRTGSRTPLASWEGTATTTTPAPLTAPVRSVVASSPDGRRWPGT